MRSLFFSLILALFLAVSAGMSAQQSSHDSDIAELQRLEKIWNDAHEQGDAAALEQIWADDLEIAVPRMPVISRSEAVTFAHSGRMKFLSYRTSDLHVRIYGDAAVVTGRLQRERMLNGNNASDDWRFTKTYIRRDKKWRVVDFHASEAAQP